jgi:hypothetical protein
VLTQRNKLFKSLFALARMRFAKLEAVIAFGERDGRWIG